MAAAQRAPLSIPPVRPPALSQEVRSARAKVQVLKNELASEMKAKEMLMRDLDDEKSKLVDLRLRYTEKGKDSVVHMSPNHSACMGHHARVRCGGE